MPPRADGAIQKRVPDSKPTGSRDDIEQALAGLSNDGLRTFLREWLSERSVAVRRDFAERALRFAEGRKDDDARADELSRAEEIRRLLRENRRGEAREALEAALTALESPFQRAELAHTLGCLELDEGAPREAETALRRAFVEEPTPARAWAWLSLSASNPESIPTSALKEIDASRPHPLPTSTRSFLAALAGSADDAAEALKQASGLGWSSVEHPGHLLFPVVLTFAAGTAQDRTVTAELWDTTERLLEDGQRGIGTVLPALPFVPLKSYVARLSQAAALDPEHRRQLLAALIAAATHRLEMAASMQRRRAYPHCAQLVVAAAEGVTALDGHDQGAALLSAVQGSYRSRPTFVDQLVEAAERSGTLAR